MHKNPLVFFAQPKKVHSRKKLFLVNSGKENKYLKILPFSTGQVGKVSLMKYLIPQLRKASFCF
jgi:hypothetical protein